MAGAQQLTCIEEDEWHLHEPILVLILMHPGEGDHAMRGIFAQQGQRVCGTHSSNETAPTSPPASTYKPPHVTNYKEGTCIGGAHPH